MGCFQSVLCSFIISKQNNSLFYLAVAECTGEVSKNYVQPDDPEYGMFLWWHATEICPCPLKS